MTISKAHLIDSICARLDLPRRHSAKLTESLLEIIKTTLQNGEDILVSGFGKFHVKDNRDRRGRNPVIGNDRTLDSRRVVTSRCSPVLRDKLNGGR